jgi:2-oxoglutarate dehydrogenase E1 component
MGAWSFIEPLLRVMFCSEIAYAGRSSSASTAVGALARHKREQARLVADAFSI